MLKRWSIAGIVLLTGAVVLAFFWQPDRFKQWGLDTALKTVNRRLPYTLHVDAIHGNVFGTIDLENVRVFSKAPVKEVLVIPDLKVRMAWFDLLHYEARLRYIFLKLGAGTLEGAGTLQLNGVPSGAIALTTHEFPVHTLAGMYTSLPSSVRLVHSGDWTVHFGSGTWNVSTAGKLNQASMHLAARGQKGNYNGNINLKRLDLSQAGFSQLGRQQLSLNLRVLGQMAYLKQPSVEGELTLEAAQQKTPWVTAQLHVHEGRGTLVGQASTEGSHAAIQTKLNIPDEKAQGTWRIDEETFAGLKVWQPALQSATGQFHAQGAFELADGRWSVTGTAQGQDISWDEKHVRSVHGSFSASQAGLKDLQISAEDLALHHPTQPMDMKNVTLEAHLKGTHWETTVSGHFQNDMNVNASGALSQSQTQWRYLFSHLEIALPGQASAWQLATPGAAVEYREGFLSVAHLDLTRGVETLSLDHFQNEGSRYEARFRTSKLDPAVLQLFLPGVTTHGGSIQMVMDISGNDKMLTANGHLTADIIGMKIPDAGLDFQTVQADVVCSSGVIQVNNLLAQTKKGEVRISGTAHLPALDFTLQSKNLALEIGKQIKAQTNLNLRLAGTVSVPHLSGDIVLVKGAYDIGKEEKKKKKKKKKDKDKTPPPPVLIQAVSSEPSAKPAIWIRTEMDVTTHWERDVWYRDGLTDIETQADLTLKKASMSEDLLLTGQLASVQGTYTYYGKDFTIESGQLQFTGSPDFNPLMTVEASFESDPTIVYLDITGTVKKPVLKLRSVPPLPDSDIISVLVFGRPLKDLSPAAGGRSTNQEMTGMAGSVLGSYLSKSLRETGIQELNFDVVNVEPTSTGNVLTVGRYVTRNLFVSYGQTVAQDGGKGFTADYYLGKRWAVEGEAGSIGSSHLDLLFRYPINAMASRTLEPLHQSPFRNTLDDPTLNPLTPYLPQ